jgi:23S rRNA (guanosine2251-2'-O)-methyltransferase
MAYTDVDGNMRIAIVIGNEGKGMSRLVKEQCDFLASIPMKGTINSLNASVSAALMMYHVFLQRQ